MTDDTYWIRNCHGFRVYSPRGRLGIVEDVLYGGDPDRPAALAVRGGLFGAERSLHAIGRAGDAGFCGAVGAAKHAAVGLDAVPNDPAAAVLAGRSERVDRAIAIVPMMPG